MRISAFRRLGATGVVSAEAVANLLQRDYHDPMTKPLFVFGDEYGTMPVKDGDDPFLAAAVAIWGHPPMETQTSGHPERVAAKLCELGALVHVAYVIPATGYEEMLQSKIATLNALARVNYEKDGRNAKFWNTYGIPIRNHVWQTCMGAALSSVIASAALTGPVEEVRIHLDRKTLSDESLATFSAAVGRILGNLRELLSRFSNSANATQALEGLHGSPPKSPFVILEHLGSGGGP